MIMKQTNPLPDKQTVTLYSIEIHKSHQFRWGTTPQSFKEQEKFVHSIKLFHIFYMRTHYTLHTTNTISLLFVIKILACTVPAHQEQLNFITMATA